MPLPKHFISVDWGTSNFRLSLVETDELAVLFEMQSDQGVRSLYEQFTVQQDLGQEAFFKHFLNRQILQLDANFHTCPTMISGMASSSIGMLDLPYSNFPIDRSAANIYCQTLTLSCGVQSWLISGVKGDIGMMRGEETQAVGLAPFLPDFGPAVLLLPGTHSKHLWFENGQYHALNNFMTGELFEVLSKHSILSASVATNAWTSATQKAFIKGLEMGFEQRLSQNLFLIRAKHVLNQTPVTDNYYLLSGLLIGDELAHLKVSSCRIFLAAAQPISHLYQLALRTLFPKERLTFFDDKVLKKALFAGQKTILERYVH